MRKPQVRHTPHRKADEGNEAERPQDQKRHDVYIRISHKKLRLEAGEGEHEGSRDADGQHLGDIGSATDTAHGIKERGKQAKVPLPVSFLPLRQPPDQKALSLPRCP